MNNTIYPCIWCNGNAREAASLYLSAFDNSEIISENPMVIMLELSGQRFMLLNGDVEFTVNPSMSFFVVCETEQKVNDTWNKLSEGGISLMPLDKYPWSPRYGWIQDRYGVSWQVMTGHRQDFGQIFTPAFLFTREQNGNAEHAIRYYTSIFKNSSIIGIYRYEKGEGDIEGNVKHAQFTLDGQRFIAMDSSAKHAFSFNEGISLVVECDSQDKIDYYWNRLTEGGTEVACGWLKDKFGFFWQIVPSILGELMSDPARSQRVVDAFMKMKKFDIETLVNA